MSLGPAFPITTDIGEYAVAGEHEKSFDAKLWEAASQQKRDLPIFNGPLHEPSPESVSAALGNQPAGLIADAKVDVTVTAVENPAPSASFGFIGVCVEVSSAQTFVPGTLVTRFTPDALAGVARETLSLFRWEKANSRYDRVGVSRVAADEDYVWGRISAPGIYAVIGLHSHPLVVRTVALLDMVAGLADALGPDERKTLLQGVCGLLLGSPALSAAINNPAVLYHLRQESWKLGLPDPIGAWKPNPGFDGGDLIDRCPALPGFLTPEGALLPFSGRWTTIERPAVGVDTGWENVGPVNLAGAMIQVVVDPVNPDRLYAAATDGGVWTLPSVAEYGDLVWQPLTDSARTLASQAIAVAPSDPEVIYWADGMAGLLRSDTRGETWVLTSDRDLGFVRRILVDPHDALTVYAATDGGLWRSHDGGASWEGAAAEAPLYGGAVTDAAMDPDNASILYIGVRGMGVLKSTSSGASWELVLSWSAATAPTSTMIKLALGRLGSEADRMVAVRLGQEVFTNHHGGRIAAEGGDWASKGSVDGDGYGDWCHVIAVDPFDNDVILSGGQELFRSGDGGSTWVNVISEYADTHADQHSIAFDPTQRGVVYVANDGGIVRSADAGATWRTIRWGLVTGQLFPLGVHGERAVTGMDHHGIQTTPNLSSRVWAGPGGGGWEWTRAYADPQRADIYYLAHDDLLQMRYPGTAAFDATDPFGTPTIHPNLSGSTVCPVAVDPRDDSTTVLVATGPPGRVMRTLDVTVDAPSWTEVAGISLDTAGITAVAFAPSASGIAYAMSDDGHVFATSDPNAADPWTAPGQWATSGVVQIAVNALHDDRLYAITEIDIALSVDGGGNWNSIGPRGSRGLPPSPLRSIVAHPTETRTLFVGMDVGVFVSVNEGMSWVSFADGLPNAVITGLLWESGYLYASTYGRGLWRRRPGL